MQNDAEAYTALKDIYETFSSENTEDQYKWYKTFIDNLLVENGVDSIDALDLEVVETTLNTFHEKLKLDNPELPTAEAPNISEMLKSSEEKGKLKAENANLQEQLQANRDKLLAAESIIVEYDKILADQNVDPENYQSSNTDDKDTKIENLENSGGHHEVGDKSIVSTKMNPDDDIDDRLVSKTESQTYAENDNLGKSPEEIEAIENEIKKGKLVMENNTVLLEEYKALGTPAEIRELLGKTTPAEEKAALLEEQLAEVKDSRDTLKSESAALQEIINDKEDEIANLEKEKVELTEKVAELVEEVTEVAEIGTKEEILEVMEEFEELKTKNESVSLADKYGVSPQLALETLRETGTVRGAHRILRNISKNESGFTLGRTSKAKTESAEVTGRNFKPRSKNESAAGKWDQLARSMNALK